MKQFDFERYSPPGRPVSVFRAVFLVLLMVEIIWGLSFLAEVGENVALLNDEGYRQRFAVTDFAELMDGRLTALPVGVLAMGAMAVINYSAFYQNSKSIYLMRRLPDKWELTRRTVALPAMACGVYVIVGVLLFAVCVLGYRLMMPEQHLPEDWVRSVIESVTTLRIFGV